MTARRLVASGVVLAVSCGGAREDAATPGGPAVIHVAASADPAPAGDAPPPVQARQGTGGAEPCIAELREPGLEQDEDRTTYATALSLEKKGDPRGARRAYFELLQRPTATASHYAPLCYFAFGELFRADIRRDPAMSSLAGEAYRQVTHYPTAGTPIAVAARFRLGQIEQSGADHARALSDLLATLAATRAPGPACLVEIGAEAGRLLVKSYAVVGRPEVALDFFRSASGEGADAGATLASFVGLLVDEYLARGQASDGVMVLSKALGGTPSAERCRTANTRIDRLRRAGAPVADVEKRLQAACR